MNTGTDCSITIIYIFVPENVNNIETDGSFFCKKGAVMLPKVIQRFLAENNLPHEHDAKGMNILTRQLYNCAVDVPLHYLSVI
jgi:hypothetical protein